jgi:hypothetical protein
MKDEFFRTFPTSQTLNWGQGWVGLTQKFERMFEGRNEMTSKSLLLTFIPNSSFFEFLSGILAYFYLFHLPRNRALALVRTCSVSTKELGLASISLILPHISTSQASESPDSEGPSKLATRSLANLARSDSERAKTSDRNDSSCAVVILNPIATVPNLIMHQT